LTLTTRTVPSFAKAKAATRGQRDADQIANSRGPLWAYAVSEGTGAPGGVVGGSRFNRLSVGEVRDALSIGAL
jgi:hypothetical protein